MKISGKLIDLHLRSIYGAEIEVLNGKVHTVIRKDNVPEQYIMPGFIDAHVHVESSMTTPGAFAAEAVRHGTVGVIADPHEIANVLGVGGVNYMIDDAKKVPVKFLFGVPSCVPATPFESAGAEIGSADVKQLLDEERVGFLGEVMNFPGVVSGDKEILEKIQAAKNSGKPVDGHAPGLTGEDLNIYSSYGISTDHECTTIAEALEKIRMGMKILIREGSAAKNLEELHGLLGEYPENVMLCCDDIHPDDLTGGHIDHLVKRLMEKGYDIFDVLSAASLNAVRHYGIDVGLLKEGDSADFIIVDDPRELNIISTYINGTKVFDNGRVLFSPPQSVRVNRFNAAPITERDILADVNGKKIRVIEVEDRQLWTRSVIIQATMPSLHTHDTVNDILKIVVKERYRNSAPVTGFIKGFGLKNGSLASSVAHDSHNIIAVGADDDSIVKAVNRVIEMKGGLAWASPNELLSLPLDVAGIMSGSPVMEVASSYRMLNEAVRSAGSTLTAPFMTLSFMALLVMPELKIGDRGLFDVNKFEVVPLIAGS
jgi:adenine deaminase